MVLQFGSESEAISLLEIFCTPRGQFGEESHFGVHSEYLFVCLHTLIYIHHYYIPDLYTALLSYTRIGVRKVGWGV